MRVTTFVSNAVGAVPQLRVQPVDHVRFSHSRVTHDGDQQGAGRRIFLQQRLEQILLGPQFALGELSSMR